MPKTIGVERATSKWINRARVATPDYEAGVKSPKRPWAASAMAASGTYHSAVSSPNTKALFERGIKRAGDARWADMSAKKGVERYATGVELSEPYYRSQMGDVIGVIERTTLSSRGPRGSAANYTRVKEQGDALHAWRLAKRASSGA